MPTFLLPLFHLPATKRLPWEPHPAKATCGTMGAACRREAPSSGALSLREAVLSGDLESCEAAVGRGEDVNQRRFRVRRGGGRRADRGRRRRRRLDTPDGGGCGELVRPASVAQPLTAAPGKVGRVRQAAPLSRRGRGSPLRAGARSSARHERPLCHAGAGRGPRGSLLAGCADGARQVASGADVNEAPPPSFQTRARASRRRQQPPHTGLTPPSQPSWWRPARASCRR